MEFKEEIRNFKNERVYRIKAGVIIGGGLLCLVSGLIFFWLSIAYGIRYMSTFGGILTFFVFPVTLVYPVVRFFMGGRDSVLGLVISVVLEEYLKGKIKNKMREDKKQ
jgi:hypothetical protein